MTPIQFSNSARRLFGQFHQATGTNKASKSVLLCNPFGQEAVRTHRMYRVLADRLSRSGADVLRFDYYASGDSFGDDDEADLEGWKSDIVAADDELRRRTRNAQVVWIGARLGASLAALACGRATTSPSRLILWDAITVGCDYLAELDVAHQRTLTLGYSFPAPELLTRPAAEAIGFGLSTAFNQQLERLTPEAFSDPVASAVTAISGAENRKHTDSLLQRMRANGANCRHIEFEHLFDWTSEEALNTALVPADAINLLVSEARQAS